MMQESRYDGRRVEIIGNHPHSGCFGVIIGRDKTPVGIGWVVLLDSSESCFVFSPDNIVLIDSERN